jgi:hypothetical protein
LRALRRLFIEARGYEVRNARWGEQVAAAIMPLERRARRSGIVIRLIATLALASAAPFAAAATLPSATSSHALAAALESSAPWWEKVTVTISNDGQPRSCMFESSLRPDAGQACQVQASQAAAARTAGGSKDSYTRITFERRFNPEWKPEANEAPTGDMLLGRQVMSLAIGAKGAVEGCRIVDASGDMKPEYGCKEASAERFQAAATTEHAAPRQAYMTILVYGHSEHVV